MVEVGILTALGLWLVGTPLPVALGVVTGILNFVPNIGPIVAGQLSALIALTVSPVVALYVLLVQTGAGR